MSVYCRLLHSRAEPVYMTLYILLDVNGGSAGKVAHAVVQMSLRALFGSAICQLSSNTHQEAYMFSYATIMVTDADVNL